MRTKISCAAATLLIACAGSAIPSFPGAEGFGGSFTGAAPAGGWFSNANIYHVTTTADTINAATGKPDMGTLRGAFYDYTNPNSPKQNATNRIVVFDVGGVFQLTQGSLDIKTVNNIYVAGQTAPSPVTVYGNTTQITKSSNTMTSNVVLRYMTFRKGAGDGQDAITFAGGNGAGDTIASNMILDHVSASWSEDENLSVANNNTNVTVQYSVIADSLVSNHAYGSLIRPQVNSSVTFHHNLYANNASRQARFGTYNAATLTAEFTNNVIYNWRDRASYTGGSAETLQEYTDVNYIGNYLVAGPGTIGAPDVAYSVDKNVDTRVYQSGNFIDSDKGVNPGGVPNGSDLGWGAFVVSTPVTDQTMTQMGSAFAMAPVTTQSAVGAYSQVINYVGNHWWNRESIDARIIGNVLNGTNAPSGIGAAAPNAAELAAMLATPTVSRAAGWDTDNDGMPDAWETARGLNPNSAADLGLDFDSDGYVNVIEYVNEAGAFPAPAPIVFSGALSNRFAHSDNWATNWQPSHYDTAKVNSGTAVIDAVGQQVGTLLIGADSGSSGRVQVNSGWLHAADSVQVGSSSGSSGTLVLNGGALKTARLTRIGNTGTVQFNGGKLDIAGGAAIFDYTVSSPLVAVRNAIFSAYAGGAWNGAGLTSSLAPLNANLAIGYAEASALSLPGNLFEGESVDGTTLLAVCTVKGDANLDGTVNSTDFTALLNGYGSGTGWWQGDFSYDLKVNTLDFNILAANFGLSAGTLPASLGANVPEPTVAVSTLVLLMLRRKRDQA